MSIGSAFAKAIGKKAGTGKRMKWKDITKGKKAGTGKRMKWKDITKPLDYEQVRPSKRSVREGKPSNVNTLANKERTLANPISQVARRRSALKGAGVGAGAVGAGVGIKEALDSGDTGPSPTKAASKKSYKIKKGDTLSEIAMEHGVTVRDLMRANPSIKDKDKIKAGQVIKIPKNPPLPVRSKPETRSHGGKVAKRSGGGKISKPQGWGKARPRNSGGKVIEGYKEGGQV